MSEVDMFKYGQLVAQVDSLDKKVDKLEGKIEELLALANKGRGGFWMGMTFISLSSSAVGYFSHFFTKN
jgi:hypothetical protein